MRVKYNLFVMINTFFFFFHYLLNQKLPNYSMRSASGRRRSRLRRCLKHSFHRILQPPIGFHFFVVFLLGILIHIDVDLLVDRFEGSPSTGQLSGEFLLGELRFAGHEFAVQFAHQNGSAFLAELEERIGRSFGCVGVLFLNRI